MNGRDLISVLLLGVLLPVCFSRPPFLREHPMRPHIRARWNFAYSVAAFAAIGFVYVSTEYLLKPVKDVTAATRSTLSVAGLLLFLIACAHHLPPLIGGSRSKWATASGVVCSVIVGVTAGGFLAVDAIWARVKSPVVADVSWGALVLVAGAAAIAYGGLSPELRFALYVRRRQRRRQQRERG
jgi:hypothetical protein